MGVQAQRVLRSSIALVSWMVLSAGSAVAQVTCGPTTALGTYQWTASGRLTRSNDCLGSTGFRCYEAEGTGFSVEKASPSCNPSAGSCAVKIHVTATIPGLRDMIVEDGLFGSLTPWFEWYPCAGAGCPKDMICGLDGSGRINFDNVDNWLQRGLSCTQARTLNFSVKIRVCATSSDCEKTTIIDIPGAGLAAGLGCPDILPNTCTEGSGSASGAAGTSCPLCQPVGGDSGCAVSVDGKLSCAPASLGKARVRYAAGGVGGDNLPGSAAWRTVLGRFWSHEFSERIVVDPDTSHVWLLTRYGSFREFSSLAAGSGLRLYQSRAPSDEFRKLFFDTATGGWQLHSLDGRKDFFRSDGLWQQTVLASDPSHPIQGTYNAGNQLVTVGFHDGRSDSFTYHPSGKLASITEAPVPGSGTPARTWSFTWSGEELTLATRPDGTSWEFIYDPSRPGYLIRIDLVAGPQHRIAAAFEYAAGTNNVSRSWRGDVGFNDPNATDKVTYSFTNPVLPTQTVVTRTVSATFNQVTTYAIARDTVSAKPRPTSIQGSCPTCGLSPTTTFTYTGGNPLLPSSTTDAKGTRTNYTYNADGRLLTKTEAANVAGLTRTTSYTYDTNFPGLVARVEVPSTSGGADKRRTDSGYDATTSLMTSRTIDGFEAGAPLPAGSKVTTYSYNASGEVLTIDPPGFGTADATTFTYNLAGRNGHVADSRTDPLVGTTAFGYDGLNRRTSVIDANGVETQTSYDSLSRVIEVRQKGATPADDLVATSTYNSFGDLFCTKLPRGNGLESVYDTAGRLTHILRGTAVATPTSTSCLDPALPRERTAYQLDGAGNRIEESLERWNGTGWVSESKTAYEFTCHLDRATRGTGSPAPSVTEYCYDLNDNLEKVWDANHPRASHPNPTQLYAYDALNRLTSLTQSWTGAGGATAVTSYTYDVQDHLASVTDAEGNATTYTYSDRDLLTQQVSPVSGTTTSAYNEHGELVTTTDARGIVTTRTIDAADRLTQQTFGPPGSPDPALTITYAYGSTPAQFNVGRLTGITRSGQTIAYTYDRFGRVLQDGSLTYGYDKNGNRATIAYPGGVSAFYTHDFADRETTLSYDSGKGPRPLVTSAGYKPSGPLSALTFANGLSETRLFDARYFPDRIQAGALLDWDYTEDAVGNPTQITGTIVGQPYTATFAYQDPQYFLTQGNGPWGTRAWTYDRIGNRLTNQESGEPTQTYAYAGTGHNPKLLQITPAPGLGTGVRQLAYDAAGNQISVQETDEEGSVEMTFLDASPESRLSTLRPTTAPGRTDMLYDGRGYLRQAHLTFTGSPENVKITPAYSSEGLLMSRTEERQWSGDTPGPDGEDSIWLVSNDETTHLFNFAGRPVAQLTDGSLFYVTTDHLGTPVLITNTSGSSVWGGGLEPFGRTWSAGGNPDPEPFSAFRQEDKALSRLSSESAFLRYPGQWASDAFRVGGVRMEVYYNVHRWYEVGVGRYGQVDPINLGFLENVGRTQELPVDALEAYYLAMLRAGNPEHETPYLYAVQNPLLFTDTLGLFGPGALATAGGGCMAIDGPLPIGDVIGIPLLVGAGIWALSDIVVDWWDNRKTCSECDDDFPADDYCKKMKLLCAEKCTEESIPTGTNDGAPFFACVTRCLASVGCGNYWG